MKVYKVEGYVNGLNELSDVSLMQLQEEISNSALLDILIQIHEVDSVELDSFEEEFENSAFNFASSTQEDLDKEFDRFKEK